MVTEPRGRGRRTGLSLPGAGSADTPVRTDEKYRASRDLLHTVLLVVGDAVRVADVLRAIGEKRKRDVPFLAEPSVRVRAVTANPVHVEVVPWHELR